MFRRFRSSKGQGIVAEYMVILMVVIAAVATMFTYIKRTLQGRVYDAQCVVMNRASEALNSPVAMEYEPYYVQSFTATDSYQSQLTHAGGLFNKIDSAAKISDTVAEQYPPIAAQGGTTP